MRFFVILIASFASFYHWEAFATTANGMTTDSFGTSRDLQDASICQELQGIIEANTTAMDIQGSCQCSTTGEGDTRLTCQRSDACISSDGGDPMQGDFTATFTKDSEGSSFTQTITTEICFQYPSDMYDGNKVCVSNVRDGFGTISTCQIQVGDDFCSVCRYCPINLISFDCTNVGYEDRTACGDNNTDSSILQFLYEPELVTGCSGGDGGDSSAAGGTILSPTASPTTAGAIVVHSIVATLFLGLVPLLWMG